MLPDRYCRLLTAYVDGELSSRQRRLVVRLLHRSAEARQLFQQLKADAHALRHLPRPPLPTDLTEPVLHTITARNLTTGRRRLVKAASTSMWIRPVASWAVAAAVLLALGVASYFYFAVSLDQSAKTEMAHKQPELSNPSPLSPLPSPPTPTAEREPQTPKSDERIADRKPQQAEGEKRKAESGKQHRNQPKVSPADKPPPPKEETVLANRPEMFSLDRVPDLLPVVVKISELDRVSARRKLLDELRKDSVFHLELPCPNGAKAFDRVQNAARALHIGLLIDKQAQERIKLRWRTNYVLYMENITPEELTRFVQQIGAEDRKSTADKKNVDAQIDYLVLTRLTAGARKELATLLGVDPIPMAPSVTGPLGADPRSSLSEATAHPVGQTWARQGEPPQPEPGKAEAKPSEQVALVLTYNPARPSAGSEEIKHFLEGRKPGRTGALRIFLVLRSVS